MNVVLLVFVALTLAAGVVTLPVLIHSEGPNQN